MKFYIVFFTLFVSCRLHAQRSATLSIDLQKKEATVPATLHGIFFEEISHAGDGGLYAELIQNRGFEESRIPPGTTLKDGFIVPAERPHYMMQPKASDWKMPWTLKNDWPAWSAETNGTAEMQLQITKEFPLTDASPNALRVKIKKRNATDKTSLINDGYWGIKAEKNETYLLSFYARSQNLYKGSITVSLRSPEGELLGKYRFPVLKQQGWQQYKCEIKATGSHDKAKFVMDFDKEGELLIDFVSLFPAHTFKNRVNGLRKDLARLIADLKPSFIRWPGGCFVEGITIENAADWKKTIGPLEQRPGTYSPWGYWSSDGFGYHEYLQFCEDINADALFVFNVGVSCEYRSGTFAPDDSIQPYIQNALDAIEYAIGPANTGWGKKRAANGHAQPFPLKYIEIGNEQHGPLYAKRYNVFFDAIKKKYPQLRIMASMGIGDVNRRTLDSMKRVDLADEHAYKPANWSYVNYDHFDKYKRGDWEMYVGEYATNAGVGSGNMQAALNDAVYIMSMERNADLVKMSSYAPLLVNVNDVDWPVNLINFDASKSFGRISYYAIRMMQDNKATVNIASNLSIEEPKNKTALFSGSIGLATWDTRSAYKDIKITSNGKTVYESDLINRRDDWGLIRGEWKWEDSALYQSAMGEQRFAVLKNHSFDTYTIHLKARKTDGYNAFIVPFAVKDTNTFMRVHIGSWLNANVTIENVVNGFDVSDLVRQQKLPFKIESGKWYDIRIEVGLDKVDVFLEGQHIIHYEEPKKLFAIAGLDEAKNEVVIKLVNGYNEAANINFLIQDFTTRAALGEWITLTAPSLTDENSFSNPARFVPSTRNITLKSADLRFSLAPRSINVIRIKKAGSP